MQKDGATGGKIKSSCDPRALLLGYQRLPAQGRRGTLPAPRSYGQETALTSVSVGCLVKHQHRVVHLQREGLPSGYCKHCRHICANPASPNQQGSRPPIPKKETRCTHQAHPHSVGHRAPCPNRSPPARGRCCRAEPLARPQSLPAPPSPRCSQRPQLFACGSSRGAKSREGIVPKSQPQRRGELKGGREAKLERGEE